LHIALEQMQQNLERVVDEWGPAEHAAGAKA